MDTSRPSGVSRRSLLASLAAAPFVAASAEPGIAQEAGVRTLVLSHLTPAVDSIGDETWRAPVAKYFKGEIVVGKDLMVV